MTIKANRSTITKAKYITIMCTLTQPTTIKALSTIKVNSQQLLRQNILLLICTLSQPTTIKASRTIYANRPTNAYYSCCTLPSLRQQANKYLLFMLYFTQPTTIKAPCAIKANSPPRRHSFTYLKEQLSSLHQADFSAEYFRCCVSQTRFLSVLSNPFSKK